MSDDLSTAFFFQGTTRLDGRGGLVVYPGKVVGTFVPGIPSPFKPDSTTLYGYAGAIQEYQGAQFVATEVGIYKSTTQMGGITKIEFRVERISAALQATTLEEAVQLWEAELERRLATRGKLTPGL
ncbi:hypothetical protein MF271_10565 [Deinococcus sp. KNUC1210]|uniref:hypothetical protein n=1 Tax=Deinococcus sp. KNUC1210 TaxID=2917691 RepID=UPI001EF0A69F|nr:hypothetical protein [Deinococcus sp. KNUC1210]ULH14476.1 hypothetical protein MF271_10565 [Deinococcus sp. KNUC1210]